ncbi:hypothetical protein LCGC14_1316690 [marine sediment metagenome]|uniref:ABC transmembrane type-1 domain-containing protein n=1 Tax=marine sediment metagenome TaxID=412755 RepID=A0A0F9KL79_9ZZZZ
MVGSGRTFDRLKAYAFLLPNFLGFACITLGPVLASLVLAFCHWDVVTPPRLAGVGNFARMFGEPEFWQFFGNTLFLMMSIPVGMMLSLALAVLLNRKLRGMVFFRSVYFLPSVCAGVALLMLWSWLYSPEVGLINQLIRKLTGLEGPAWLVHTAWAKPALIIMGLWTGMGGRSMLLYLAALQSIDPTLYEAASIDGAGPWRKFRNVTWPMLSPTTFFIFIMSVIGGFQTGFQQAYVMTKGGPAGATTTLSYYIFTEAFVELSMGYASAVAWFLFLLVFAVTLVNWRFGGKLVHY